MHCAVAVRFSACRCVAQGRSQATVIAPHLKVYCRPCLSLSTVTACAAKLAFPPALVGADTFAHICTVSIWRHCWQKYEVNCLNMHIYILQHAVFFPAARFTGSAHILWWPNLFFCSPHSSLSSLYLRLLFVIWNEAEAFSKKTLGRRWEQLFCGFVLIFKECLVPLVGWVGKYYSRLIYRQKYILWRGTSVMLF